jgi:cupin fold WbuC family metalloprotein
LLGTGTVAVSDAGLDELVRVARRNPLGRARINAHPDPSASIHEMLIAFTGDSYIRPHRHNAKIESFHVIQGDLEALTFDDAGHVTRRLALGSLQSGKTFYLRNENNEWHSFLVQSPYAIIHETTNGPFDPSETEFAPWSPEPDNPLVVKEYLKDLAC